MERNESAGIAAEAAIEHAECCICIMPLCDETVAVLVNESKRTHLRQRSCPHYFHYDCMCQMPSFGQRCPLCRTPYTHCEKMPDPQADPDIWFKYVDSDQSGYLSQNNVRDVILATLSLDQTVLEKLLEENWERWDRTKSGGITRKELPGLLNFVKESLGRTSPPAFKEVPDISDRKAWFDFWDEDQDGSLDRGEVARGMVKTFDQNIITPNRTLSREKIQAFQMSLEAVWGTFDHNGSGKITRAEFLSPNGLADAIIALLESDPQYSPRGSPRARSSRGSVVRDTSLPVINA
eukprot:TRINITY_DN17912_c0_g1_i1.p1 TRINITY_DN17912_c0_g1~~TRINITY_DN17912_c0_g1_i1.p1  ORF type:complete len:293 (+),score=69.47 TRINITY_DN17912_c0_g1_i1:42-920(+)